MPELEAAWSWREGRGIFSETEACRVFHGPGEGRGPLACLAIDRFGEHYWVTEWEGTTNAPMSATVLKCVQDFLVGKKAHSAVLLRRPQKGVPSEPEVVFGKPPVEKFSLREGKASYWIQLLGARHPGLFLDHAPLREWLMKRSHAWRVLNTFAYTGSLSIASGLGGAGHVTTLDLSKATLRWAEENWKLNQLSPDRARFISGDVFEWLPRLKREKQSYDCVILDPPSFSRGTKGSFSTAKDLKKLHELAIDVLAQDGVLITSINSASVSWNKYEADIAAACATRKAAFKVIARIDLPETFPTLLGVPEDRYLKGWILRRV